MIKSAPIQIRAGGPPDKFSEYEMECFDKLPESVRERLDTGKAGEICPVQTVYEICGTDEEKAHKFLDDVERTHKKRFG